jgi:hypothetical protein
MYTSEFWPALRRLAECHESQGQDSDERVAVALRLFRDLSPTEQRQLLGDLLRLAMDLPDLYSPAHAAVVQAENCGPQFFVGNG